MSKWSGKLEPAEVRLLFCAERGEQYYPGRPPTRQPMEEWGSDRTVRAEVLRHLLVEQEWPVHPKGVVLRKVRISGHIDLDSATVRWPVRLEECYLDADEAVMLESATVSELALLECRVAGISAGRLVVIKGLDLTLSTFTQPIQLTDADISGGLYFHGATLSGKDSNGYALLGSRMKVGGGCFMTDFQMSGFPAQPFRSAGAIILDDAEISGGLQCDGAHFDGRQAEGFALLGYRMKVTGEVTMKGVRAPSGAIGLVDADITGPLRLAGARVSGLDESRTSLNADAIKVGSGAYLGPGFSCDGAVSLRDAIITGQLSFRAATISGKDTDGVALSADRATVTGGLWLDSGFTSGGTIRLSGAVITGMLSCAGAQLNAADEDRNSLVADGAAVSGDAHFDSGFRAVGTVSLRSASIGGSLRVMPAELAADPGTAVALDATGAQVGHELRWEPDGPVSARVLLEQASANGLYDSWAGAGETARPNGYWPPAGQGRLALNGFTYNRFAGTPASVEQRLAWIGSYPRRSTVNDKSSFAPQPYEHLVQVYQQAGHDAEARTVAIARRRDLRRYGNLSAPRKTGNWLLDKTIRYGYETWRALILLAALYAVVFAVFLIAQHQPTLVVPSQSVTGLHPVPTATSCTKDYPCFYPVGYAFDTVIPLINIGQGGYWRPNADNPFGWFFVVTSWAGTALGWTLATLIVAGYTGLARRVDNP